MFYYLIFRHWFVFVGMHTRFYHIDLHFLLTVWVVLEINSYKIYHAHALAFWLIFMTLNIIFFSSCKFRASWFSLQKLDILSDSSPLPQSDSTLNDTMASALSDSLDTININIGSGKLTEEYSTGIASVTNTIQVIQFNASLFPSNVLSWCLVWA